MKENCPYCGKRLRQIIKRSGVCDSCGVEWFDKPGYIGVRKRSNCRYWDCVNGFSVLVVVDEVEL